jgi:hypothetical protein
MIYIDTYKLSLVDESCYKKFSVGKKRSWGSIYYVERSMRISIFHEIFFAMLAYVGEAAPAFTFCYITMAIHLCCTFNSHAFNVDVFFFFFFFLSACH